MKITTSKPLITLLSCTFLGLLNACSVPFPFISSPMLKQQNANDRVIVSITEANLGNDPVKNKIFRQHTVAIIKNLKHEQGYLGHSVRIGIFADRAWTMTVWQDEVSLKNFIYGNTHKTAMKLGTSALKSARFANVVVNRSEVPLSWKKAHQLLEEQGYGLNRK